MKTLKQLGLVRDEDTALFPDGQLKNKTDSAPGTPVVRQVYGDILVNMYALLREAGLVPNNLEDNETNGYQLLEALKKLANLLNDVEQVLSVSGSNISVGINLDALPDKYVLVARAGEDYNDALTYVFRGTGNNSYGFTSPTGFLSGDVVLVVIDKATVRGYGLTAQGSASGDEVFTVFGMPVAYNDSATLYYAAEGKLFTDTPSLADLQANIRVAHGNGTVYVYTMFVLQGHVLCFCWVADVQTYVFYQFALTDLSTAQAVTLSGTTIPTGTNNEPYAYTDGEKVYLTNDGGNTINDHELVELVYAPAAKTLTLASTRILNANFTKTTNGAVVNGALVTLVLGALKKYGITTSVETDLGEYPGMMGNLFVFNKKLHFTPGEVAKQWTV